MARDAHSTPAFDLGRLRIGEVVGLLGAVVTFAALWLPWYDLPGDVAQTGWQAFDLLDIWLAIASAVAVALLLATMARTSVALPVALGVLATSVGGIATILVAYRLLNPPGPNGAASLALGAFAGLAGALLITAGAWLSMRREQPGPAVRRREAARRIPVRDAPPPGGERSERPGDASATT